MFGLKWSLRWLPWLGIWLHFYWSWVLIPLEAGLFSSSSFLWSSSKILALHSNSEHWILHQRFTKCMPRNLFQLEWSPRQTVFNDIKTYGGNLEVFFYFSECPDSVQFRTAGSRKKILGSFFQQSDLNPGWLGTKRKRYRCAMPSPQEIWKLISNRCSKQLHLNFYIINKIS